ncbi:MAG: RES family NAD+ phosphorylase [Anaeromyxobacteraceae bacterium]
MRVYRLTSRRDPTDAFSGEGARRVAGRWHPAGVRVVYTSSSVALALVENLVHMEVANLAALAFIHAVDVPDTLIETPPLASLPADWNHPKRSDHARAFGQQWAASKRSLALALPSVVVPQELNVLLNPEHPAFADLALGGPSPFAFDQRLLGNPPPAPFRKPRGK